MKRNLSQGWSGYSQHFSSAEDVVQYDDLFASDPCERACWAVQQPILIATLTALRAESSGADRPALDFACGTGRVTRVAVEAGWRVVGLDASETMLDLARHRLPDVEFHHGRLGEPETDDWVSTHGGFPLITAFRFFLNAPVDQREAVLALLADQLSSNGYVVLNNHGSAPSLRGISLRVRRKGGSTELTQRAFREMLGTARLQVIDQWGGHIMTRSLYGVTGVGVVVRALERLLPHSSVGRGLLRRFGSNQTYVCIRS